MVPYSPELTHADPVWRKTFSRDSEKNRVLCRTLRVVKTRAPYGPEKALNMESSM